jgi:perosamine synthetase
VNETLAINGGEKVINFEMDSYNTIGEEEKRLASEVLKSGKLSQYLGASGEFFRGGKFVNLLENKINEVFGSNHAVTFNSWTSGLIAQIGAIGIEPGDEIIVPPWTMSATATCILHWNAIPVFVDIDRNDFCLNTDLIEEKISERTRAILTVDIFGLPSNYSKLRNLCKKHSLILLGDSAQAPNAKIDGDHVGVLSDIGGYSLNYHKHIQSGEGGFAVTNNENYANKMRLIRNHGESVIEKHDSMSLINNIGYNFRLGEIESAVTIPQLNRIDSLVNSRISVASKFIHKLKNLNGLEFPQSVFRSNNVFYILPMILSEEILEHRNLILSALKAEGVPSLISKYTNVHRLPIFTNRIAFGSNGYPWTISRQEVFETYGTGACPVAEEFYDKSFIGLHMCSKQFSDKDIDSVVNAFIKVWDGLGLN